MINFMEGPNGNNEEGEYDNCPHCNEVKAISEVLSEYQTFDTETCAATIDLLISEVKMWRAKDSYEKKLRTTMISATVKKMEALGFKINGTEFNN